MFGFNLKWMLVFSGGALFSSASGISMKTNSETSNMDLTSKASTKAPEGVDRVIQILDKSIEQGNLKRFAAILDEICEYPYQVIEDRWTRDCVTKLQNHLDEFAMFADASAELHLKVEDAVAVLKKNLTNKIFGYTARWENTSRGTTVNPKLVNSVNLNSFQKYFCSPKILILQY